MNQLVSKTLLKRLGTKKVLELQSAPDQNAIVLTEQGEAYTWDEKLQQLSFCPGHMGKVKSIAICSSDTRFAASYSPDISAYTDGTILIRPFAAKGNRRTIATIPGIDVGVLRWDELKCDKKLKQMLMSYQHQK